MRAIVALMLSLTPTVVIAAINVAPANSHSDDVPTFDYGPAFGYLGFDDPSDRMISYFELTSSSELFVGAPPPAFEGQIWESHRAIISAPEGISEADVQLPFGSVFTGVTNVHEILSFQGRWLDGSEIAPVDLCVCGVPEPSSHHLICLALLSLLKYRRRNQL